MPEGGTVGWFHCFSGIAGDMALGALLDAGADLDEVRSLCDRLPVEGWELDVEPVLRGGLAATKVHVRVEVSSVVRTAAHIFALIDEARLPDRVRARAHGAFDALARAEGRLHRRPPDKVHFHEVGGLDAVIDIVGTCAALEVLGVDEVHASAVAHGRGVVRTTHGELPIPAPATVELLRQAPSYGLDLPIELTTPTGAALLAATVTRWGPMPSMIVGASGFGAGDRDIDGRPNVTQVVLGTLTAELPAGHPVTLLETNVDDATGETLAHAVAALLDAGAVDAWITPIVMKKGRPAHTVSALVDTALADQVAATMVSETGTLGVRGHRLERWPSSRRAEEVDVAGRRVRVKVSAGRVKVEHDDAARAARHIGIPVREVVSLAEEAWRRRQAPQLSGVADLDEGPGSGGPHSAGPDPGDPDPGHDGPDIA